MAMNVQLQVQRFNGNLEESRLKRLAFYHQLADSVRQIPGVERVGLGVPIPLSDDPISIRYAAGPDDPQYPAAGVIVARPATAPDTSSGSGGTSASPLGNF